LEIELDNCKKENEVHLAERLLTLKKELNSSHLQKIKLEKAKHEKSMIEQETSLNKEFSVKEVELMKKHEEEINSLKNKLTAQHEKLMNAAILNIKEEYKETCKQEITEDLQCSTERLKKEYQTENIKLTGIAIDV